MKSKRYMLLGYMFCLLIVKSAHAAGEGQITISAPSHGATYSSTSNVSTNVSWSGVTVTSGTYLDRRLYRSTTITANPTSDTCYFLPYRVTTASGSIAGTLYDGASQPSVAASSGGCFTGGARTTYMFQVSLVNCGSDYNGMNTCLAAPGGIISRSSRYFIHD